MTKVAVTLVSAPGITGNKQIVLCVQIKNGFLGSFKKYFALHDMLIGECTTIVCRLPLYKQYTVITI